MCYFTDNMLLIACLAILVTLLILLLGGFYVYRKTRTAVIEISEAFSDYFAPAGDDGISQFGQMVNQVAEIQAQRLGITVQAAIRGSMGGTMSKAIVPALEAEAIEAHPELSLMEALPKSLKKNPVALMGLQLLVNKMSQGQTGNNGKSPTSQAKFNL